MNEENTGTLDAETNSIASAGRMRITFKVSLRDQLICTTSFRVICALVYGPTVLCGKHASHLCGELTCFNFSHSYPEKAEINTNREKCFRGTTTNCNHFPACIFNLFKHNDHSSSKKNEVVTANVQKDGHNLEFPEYYNQTNLTTKQRISLDLTRLFTNFRLRCRGIQRNNDFSQISLN
ncbi:hypothetical protein M3Y98_01202600 [Aphelenchoides besseyi]|nr:hypothetical protein M3Y98_01202600 [Aphelenchoides besseyi]